MPQSTIDWEEVLVSNFFDEKVRERSLFELRSKKKRRNFFNKIALIPNYMTEIPKFHPDEEVSALIKILEKYGAKRSCYAISSSNRNDRRILSIKEGIDMIYNNYALTDFLIFTENLAVFQCESGGYRPSRFILYRGTTKNEKVVSP